MKSRHVNRLYIAGLALLASLVSSAVSAQTATLNIRVHKDGAELDPDPGTLIDVTGDTPVVGPTNHDDNGDMVTDRISYVYNTVASVTVSLLSGPGETVDRWERKVGSTTFKVPDAAFISFNIGSNTNVDLYLVNSPTPETEPVSCLVLPDANTLTGTPVLWGQAFHTARRTIVDPRNPAYPLNLFSGEFAEHVVDLHVRGRGLDFVWSRRYRSQEDKNSLLGNNWDHSYNIFVEDYGGTPGQVLVHMGNGRAELFSESGGFPIARYYAAGWEAELTKDFNNDQELKLRFGNGITWTFNNGGAADGKIASIADRYDNSINFDYDSSGRLITITDTLDRDYILDYGGDDLIDDLTEDAGNGRQISYAHYGASDSDGNLGDLNSVIYPAITGTVTGNNFPSGRSLTYTYDTSANQTLAGNLLTIEDGRGNMILANVYDTSDRITTQTWGNDGATDAIVSVFYPAFPTDLESGETKKRVVNDGEGNVSEFFYNANDQLERRRDYTGRAAPDLVTTQNDNRPANKLRSGDPTFYDTRYEWNTHDLLLEQRNPSGNRVVLTYGNAGTRTRINEVTQIERFAGEDAMPKLMDVFAYKSDWDSGSTPTKFTGCRCGEEFTTRHTVRDETNKIDFDIAFRFDDSGNRTGISYGALTNFPNTFHETFTYNTSGQILTRTHPDNGSSSKRLDTFSYYAAGTPGYLEHVVIDSGGFNLTHRFEYDAVGNVLRTALPRGVALGITVGLDAGETNLIYNSNDELIRWQSPVVSGSNMSRNQTDHLYDANGNLTETRVRNFNQNGALQFNNDFVSTFTYDSLNRAIQTSREIDASNNASTTIAYTRNGLPRLVTTPEAVAGNQPTNTEHRLYDERDLLFKVIRASSNTDQLTTQFDYDANGNLTTQTVGLEETPGDRRVTSFASDAFDRLDAITDALGHVTEYAYNGAGQIEKLTVREGGTTLRSDVDYIYDLSGRNIQINRAFLNSSGSTISGTVNGVATGDGSANTVVTYTDAFDVLSVAFEGNTTTHTYDTANRVETITDPRTNVVEYTYDANSNVTVLAETAINDLGGNHAFETRFEYDQLDRLIRQRQRYSTASGGLFNETDFAYDSRDNLVSQTDARGHESTFVYDGLNRRTADFFELSPGGAEVSTSAAYDRNSRLSLRTDPNGNATQYRYDALNRLTEVIYADGTRAVQQYNRFGNPSTHTDPAGTVFTTTFDKLDRLTSRTTAAATGFANPGTESFTYDALSRLTSANDDDSEVLLVWDSLGNVQSEALRIDSGDTRTITHTYDDNGNQKRTAYPGGRVLTFTHDTRDRLDAITDATGSPSTLATYDYVGSQIARRTYVANGTQLDYTYDGLGSANPAGDFGFKRIIDSAHTVTIGGGVLDRRTYLWDADQNKLQREDVRSGGPQLTHDYTYDGRSRLTGVTPSTGSPVSFTYDAAGNRTNTGYALHGADAALNNYTQTPLDDRGYDLLGNLGSFDARERWYSFDAQSRLTGYVLAGARTVDDFSSGIPGDYTVQSGTWSVTNEVLSETSAATGRILRDFPTGTEEFSFSYRSPHDAGDTADFDPERYGLAILRLLEPDSPAEWRYVALVIEPTGLYLREWEDDILVAEHDTASIVAEANTWYDMRVAYSGTNNTTIAVSWAKRGQPFAEVLSAAVTLAEDATQEFGFGVGQNGDYEFRDVYFRDTTTDTSTTQVTYQYDALGRRIARTIDPGGTPVRTEFYYDGPQIVEERVGGTVTATYVYGNGIDEVLQMARDTRGDAALDEHWYHQDDLGNVVVLTDETGNPLERYEYGEFGAPTFFDGGGSSIGATAYDNRYLFNGREYDSDTGLYHYRTRYMDPQAGRFISRDTIGLYGDPNNLGNGQAYVGNNPWTRMDPYGEITWEDVSLYLQDSALVAKGYFIDTPAGIVSGTTTAVLNPIDTATRLYAFGEAVVTNPAGTASGVWDHVRAQASTMEGQGQLVGGVVSTFAGPAATTKSLAMARQVRNLRRLDAAVPDAAPPRSIFPDLPKSESQLEFGFGRPPTSVGSDGLRPYAAKAASVHGLSFRGVEVRAVRDLSHIDETTLHAMARIGFAPKTAAGERIILHHHQQNPSGFVVEMPEINHSIRNRNQHPYGNQSGAGLSIEQRAEFDAWRVEYWKFRAQQELVSRRK